MKLSRRTLNFMLKNNYKAIDSLVRGLLLKAYGFSDEVVAAAYLLDLVRDGKLLIDDVSRLFGGKTASLIITALPYSSSDNLSSYENDRQFIKTIKNLPLNNAALICADVITSLEKVDLQFIKANKKDFDSLKIDVPVDNEQSSIRNLTTKKEIKDLIKKIPIIEVINVNNKLLENEYKELLKEGSFESLIKIIKTTYLRNKERLDNNKKKGDKDDYYFNLAEKYLYTELSIVLKMNFEETKDYVINEVNKNTK